MAAQPHVHVITVHPDPGSLTVAVASRIASTLDADGVSTSVDNLATSGFQPAYTSEDITTYRAFFDGDLQAPPADVVAEQAKIARSDALVLVFPVYWWSLPAQLKGWAERVLTGGWAWGNRRLGRTESALSRLTVHLVPLVGTDEDYFVTNGYQESMRTQVEQGIFDYTLTGRVTWTWLWLAAEHPERSLSAATALSASIATDLRQ